MPTPAGAAMPYYDQIPGKTAQYYEPWETAGKNQLPTLQDQYYQGMTDPGGRINQIGQSFQQSPGYQFALQQAQQLLKNKQAAGGMYSSGQSDQELMQLGQDMANKDYYNFLDHAQNLYNTNMQGAQGMANQGQQAAQSQADQVAQTLAAQGNLAFQNEQQKRAKKQGLFNNIVGGLGLVGQKDFGKNMFGNIAKLGSLFL